VHELSLASAVIATATKHAKGRRVKVVSIRVGTLRQVVPESLGFYFGIVAKGTLCEEAVLDQVIVEANLHCNKCEKDWKPVFPMFRCPACGSGDVVTLSGEEFEVESIDVEDEPCTAPK
jgi:hydrogenase nickel incorporation protein HypA/HybF